MMKNILVLSLILGFISAPAAANNGLYEHKTLRAMINKLIKQKVYTRSELKTLLGKAERLPEVIEKITRPAESLPWHRYKNIFLKEQRIQQGVTFMQQHYKSLNRAEKKYGVSKEVIVAILGVETRFGQHKGGFRVIDALATLAVDYPRRSAFFRKELEKFLVLTKKQKLDPLKVEGSYAGAIGFPQFMPSSYLAYAVDFDGNGQVDLINSVDDAIGSIANYLKRHGWKLNQPVTEQVAIDGKSYKRMLKKGLKPKTPVSELGKYGVKYKGKTKQATKAALVELRNTNAREYWVSYKNFYAITRYNTSKLYAMAVHQLSQAISQAHRRIAAN